MSSVQVAGNASGTGVLTVTSPNTNTNYTLTLPAATDTLAGIAATQTLTNKTIGAGTASVPPLLLTSGTNLTSATAGAIEYDGKVVYATPIGTQRGIVPTQQYYRLDSALAGANATGAQNVLGVGCTLSSSTVYEFEIVYAMSKSAGTTSHGVLISFGGTATLNNIGFWLALTAISTGFTNVSGANFSSSWITTAGSTTMVTSITSANYYISAVFKGTVSINAGGTFIPQYTLSAAPGGAYTTQAGSYMRIAPIGASGANTSVGTWA